MKTATIRDLRNSFPRVARWIEEGECVEITRSGRPFARLAPLPRPVAARPRKPDFLSRLRRLFPEETTTGPEDSVVTYYRGDR